MCEHRWKPVQRLLVLWMATGLLGAEIPRPAGTAKPDQRQHGSYVLGPQDQVVIWALEVDEISGKTFSVDDRGYISLPLIGRVAAGGKTVEQLEKDLVGRLRTYIREPQVAVNVTDLRSRPVSVMGAVNTPGIHQLRGRKTLAEVLSLAGGLRPDAGHTIKITRRLEWGRLPLPTANDDSTGQYSVAEVSTKAVAASDGQTGNIEILPHDVITVARAEAVYVVGDVNKPGGFALNERETMSVLQALSMAGGMTRTAAPKRATILRPIMGGPNRAELPVNLSAMLASKSKDVPLLPGDILFVPGSKSKSAALRAVEAAIQAGTYALTWGIR